MSPRFRVMARCASRVATAPLGSLEINVMNKKRDMRSLQLLAPAECAPPGFPCILSRALPRLGDEGKASGEIAPAHILPAYVKATHQLVLWFSYLHDGHLFTLRES